MGRWLSGGIFAAGLIALTLLAYRPAFDAGFIWDDDDYVVENEALRTPDGLRDIWLDYAATPQYYPLVHTSFWLEYRLWGLSPRGYHASNVLLHALACILLWRLLVALRLPGAWLAAAVFAVHPVHVESVAWITERKNVLSGVFALSSLLAYVRGAGLEVASTSGPSDRAYGVSLALFLCAMLSKTVSGALPAVILVLVWWRRGRIGWRDVGQLVPFFALSLIFGVVTLMLEKQHVGATGEAWTLSLVERGLIAGRALWFYAEKLVWPNPLVFNYPRWRVDSSAWWQYAYPAAALVVLFLAVSLRRRFGRGPLASLLIFGGVLFPALGFFDLYPMRYAFVADHFQYLASLALIAPACALAAKRAARGSIGVRRAAIGLAGIVLALLGTLTWRQAHAYVDAETLWRDTLRKNPASWMSHVHLGSIAERRGSLHEAIAHYRASIDIEPRQHEGRNNLGNALLRVGDRAEAEAELRRALEISPRYSYAHNNLGLVLRSLGDMAAAEAAFRRALELDSNLAAAHANLAALLVAEERIDEALRHFARVVELQPDSVEARRNLRAARALKRGELR